MNSLMVIAPYKLAGMWVFDDQKRHLLAEPFVPSVEPMINDLVKDIPDAENGFRMIFSAQPWPGSQRMVTRTAEEKGGNWYYDEVTDSEGWLCPALLKFFNTPPAAIYVRAEPLGT